jgi:hypothetical protein
MVHGRRRPITPISDKSRELQRKLYRVAKRSRNHALYDRMFRPDVLWRAWEEVRQCLDGKKRVGVFLSSRDMWVKTLKAPGRRLSESRMRENLTYGLRWQSWRRVMPWYDTAPALDPTYALQWRDSESCYYMMALIFTVYIFLFWSVAGEPQGR